MSGYPALDLLTLAFSFFNTVLLLWLGLTVLLDARRRTLGVWLAGEGLLMGAAFFTSHSVLLAQDLTRASQALNFWWHAGWIPVVLSPFAWYIVILWYTGYWEDLQSPLNRRQAPWFGVVLILTAGLIGLFIFSNPLPSFEQSGNLVVEEIFSLWGIPLVVLAYPVYILTCILLALDALMRPGPTARLMGDQARRRARPWLIASTLALLIVSILVAWVLVWIVMINPRSIASLLNLMGTDIALFDLAIGGLIAAAVLLIGQAVVVYEVFTGKALPSHGLKRYWRNAIYLAAGISLLSAWSLVEAISPVYTLLLAIILVTGFYALVGWRSLVQYQQSFARLRPFVASQKLYEQILNSSNMSSTEKELFLSFSDLCEKILNTKKAALFAAGSLAPLIREPLVYSLKQPVDLPPIFPLSASLEKDHTVPIQLDSDTYCGFIWAVPLVSERGLIGILLLGNKNDDGFYNQEEIDIARANGERLLDLRAVIELSNRLVSLQRQRMVESRVQDRQMRRIIHDEILPKLHTTLLELNSDPLHFSAEASSVLSDTHQQLSKLLRDLPLNLPPAVSRLGLIGALQQEIESELKEAFDTIVWEIESGSEEIITGLPPLISETVFFAAREVIRNAAVHGNKQIQKTPYVLKIKTQTQNGLELLIEDNGAGMINLPSGGNSSGQGLALHSTLMAVIGGSLEIESIPGESTSVTLKIPLLSDFLLIKSIDQPDAIG